jgi:hypothetical protein
MARMERPEEGERIRARRATAHVLFLFSLFFLLFRNATSRQTKPEGEPRSGERHRQQQPQELRRRRRRRARAPKNRQYGAVDVLEEQHVESRDVAVVQRGHVRNRAFRPVVVTAGDGSG